MPLGVSPGMNARLWWRGLTPKNRNHTGGPSAGLPTSCGGSRIESRSLKPEHVTVEMERFHVVAGGQHHVAEALLGGDERVPVRADDATVFERRAVEHLQAVARRVLEPDHLVDAAVGKFGLGGLFVRCAFDVEPVADLLQAFGVRTLPAGLGQPVVLARHDHQPCREVVHPQVERTFGEAAALDHAEHLQAILPPGRHVRGFDAQVPQRSNAHRAPPGTSRNLW